MSNVKYPASHYRHIIYNLVNMVGDDGKKFIRQYIDGNFKLKVSDFFDLLYVEGRYDTLYEITKNTHPTVRKRFDDFVREYYRTARASRRLYVLLREICDDDSLFDDERVGEIIFRTQMRTTIRKSRLISKWRSEIIQGIEDDIALYRAQNELEAF